MDRELKVEQLKCPLYVLDNVHASVVATLEIERDRLNGDRLSTLLRRESLMKNLFLVHYQNSTWTRVKRKILLRFGRNHLHRGYDRRGVSTLGNFVAEFAFTQHTTSFHVAAFAAGGKYFLGKPFDADERQDDPAFERLASVARYPPTVFDLRPLRPILHQIPDKDRSTVQKSLVYWADSYDAIICYREVTPSTTKSALKVHEFVPHWRLASMWAADGVLFTNQIKKEWPTSQD